MSCILNIETSTEVCSVALSNDGECIFNVEDHEGPNHAVKLGTFVDEALSFADSHALPLDAVAVSCGPGSYTGLRIGVSMAKGVCYARNAKLLAVPTLQLLCVPLLLGEKSLVGVGFHDVGLHRSSLFQRSVVERSIHFHASGVEHGA